MRLRNLTLALLLFCFSVQSWGAFLFDGGTDHYVTINDNSLLSLPDGDFSQFCWIHQTDTSTNHIRKILLWNDSGTTNRVRLQSDNQSADGVYNDLTLRLNDDAGDEILLSSANNSLTINTWLLVGFVRSGNRVDLYVGSTSILNETDATYDGVDHSGTFYIGDSDSIASREFIGYISECGRWNRALNAAEISALSNGYAPSCFPNSLVWYMPMVRDYNEIKANLTVTNSGTAVTTHPKMYYPD